MTLFQELEKLGAHLCGSRLYGDFHEQSDWDFVVDESPMVRDGLTALGFVIRSDIQETDQNTVSIYSRIWESVKIDVVVAHDAALKLRISRIVWSSPLRDFDRSLRGSPDRLKLWQALYAVSLG